MNSKKCSLICFLILVLIANILIINASQAAFDVKGVQLFKDGNVCINKVISGTTSITNLNLSSLTSNTESVQASISSSGSLCPVPPFFTGGALLSNTSGIIIQAQPTVQGLGRGILISEPFGTNGTASTSGDVAAFGSLFTRFNGATMVIFEISLPTGCDVVDDDDDIIGSSDNLSAVNDFSLPTCDSTNGLNVRCNDLGDTATLLSASNGLVAASSGSPAKIRFVVSSVSTLADGNMIDSALIKFDSQDIFCPNNFAGPLTATIIAKNAIDNPTITETIGTVDLGTPTQALKVEYANETATSIKGEVSTNSTGITPVLIGGQDSVTNTIEITELDNNSIPLTQSSALLINPPSVSSSENTIINIWLVPSYLELFSKAPSISDIKFSDPSLTISSNPYLVMNNSDDLYAPYGSIVIPVRKTTNGIDPSTVKTTITINNLGLAAAQSNTKDGSISVVLFEPISTTIVNTPGVASISNSTSPSNPQNFSAFGQSTTRAFAQNALVSGAVNDTSGASQITTNSDLSSITQRNTTLGSPQIIAFSKIISSISPIDLNKITASNSNSTITVTGIQGASIGGAKINIQSFTANQEVSFDSVTITSKSDGSFNAKLKADFSSGNITVKLKQTVSRVDSSIISKTVKQNDTVLSCNQTVCGCELPSCTPTVSLVQTFIANNGGLSQIISTGGLLLDEVINSIKTALGLS